MKRATSILHLLLFLAFAPGAAAQDPQYISPGSLANAAVSTQESVLRGAEDARWKYGRWRLSPLVSIRNVGYQENVFGAPDNEEQVSDIQLAAGLGLDSYLTLGRKAYLAAFVAPEYTYWDELDQLRHLNVNFGAGLFGFFNRMEIGLYGRSAERENPLTSELEVPVLISEESVGLEFRLELHRSLFLIGSASSSDYRHSLDLQEIAGIDPTQLDRDEDRVRTGLAIRLRNGLELGLGLEDERVDFVAAPQLRSYSGTNPLLTARLEGNRIELDATMVQRRLDFPAAMFNDRFEETTGAFRVSSEFVNDTRLVTYGSRSLVFSAYDVSGTILEDRWGLLVAREIGRRLSAEVLAETGTLDYRNSDPTSPARSDDVRALGANLGFDLSDSTTIRLVYSQSDYSSSFPQADRTITRVGVDLVLGDGLLPW